MTISDRRNRRREMTAPVKPAAVLVCVVVGLALAGGTAGGTAGGAAGGAWALALLLALSLFYLGGMYLNDAFDAVRDAVERPERPIPSGRVARGTVFALGLAMLGGGLALLLWLGLAGGTGYWPAAAGLALAAAILFYDWNHKNNPLSPLVMGLCRVLVYVTAGLAVTVPLPATLWLAAGALLCYLIGLTYIAKQETLGRVANLWPLGFLAAPLAYGAVLIAEATLGGAALARAGRLDGHGAVVPASARAR